jgi:putative transposase
MARPHPQQISLTPEQRAVLERLLRQASCPQALARRARIVLAAASGAHNQQIASELGCAFNTVRLWRRRWAEGTEQLSHEGISERELRAAVAEVLADAARPGRPDTFTAEQIVQIIALACSPPAESERPVTAWTPRELADEASKRGIVSSISPRSVGRFLKAGGAEAPWQPPLAEHNRT